jgi:hypothetical protein
MDKLALAELLNKSTAFYGTGKFIVVFIRSYQWIPNYEILVSDGGDYEDESDGHRPDDGGSTHLWDFLHFDETTRLYIPEDLSSSSPELD